MGTSIRGIENPYGKVPIALLQDAGITRNGLRVYIALASYQGNDDHCYPSLEQIAERAGLVRSRVSAATRQLEESGWVIKTSRKHRNMSSVYRVLTEVTEAQTEAQTGSDELDRLPGKRTTEVRENVPPSTSRKTYHRSSGKRTTEVLETRTSSTEKNTVKNTTKNSGQKPAFGGRIVGYYEQELCADIPSAAWKSPKREQAALGRLAELTAAVAESLSIDAAEAARTILEQYRILKRGRRSGWWSEAPSTPSALLARWDEVIAAAHKAQRILPAAAEPYTERVF